LTDGSSEWLPLVTIDKYFEEKRNTFSETTIEKQSAVLRFIERSKLRKALALATRKDIVGLVANMNEGVWREVVKDGNVIREVRLRNRTPMNYCLMLVAFFDWVQNALEKKNPYYDHPMREMKISAGEDPKKPIIVDRDYDRLMADLQATSKQTRAPEGAIEAKLIYRIISLLYENGLRGGELLPYGSHDRKSICTCDRAADRCTKNPPHDFKFLEDGIVSIRVKGAPEKKRFSEKQLTDEEVKWLRGDPKEEDERLREGIINHPPWVMNSFDYQLARLQRKLGIELVDRKGRPVPIAEARLTSHSFRRSAATKLVNENTSVPIINTHMGWSPNSKQAARYGEQSPAANREVVQRILHRRRRQPSPEPQAKSE
jgi:integrase